MATLPQAKDKAEYEAWFRQADKNGDGFLTAKELKTLFKARKFKTKSKQFKQIFANLDKDGDKKVTLAEYLKEMGEGAESGPDSDSDSDPGAAATPEPNKAEYEAWFRAADKNNDGFLTAKELKALFKARKYKTKSKQFKQHFANLDNDGDKKITFDEYMKELASIPQLLVTQPATEQSKMATLPQAKDKAEYEAWFRQADKNGDGFLTAKELKALFKARSYKTKSKQFKSIFANLDKDGDKKITLAEYLKEMGQEADLVDSDSDSDPGAAATPEPNKAEYEAWFRAADKNNDGFLTAKELKALFKARKYKTKSKQFKQHFANLDKDGDKKITLDEYLKEMASIPQLLGTSVEVKGTKANELPQAKDKAEYETWFRTADKNGDGSLSTKELKALFKARGYKTSSKQFKAHFSSLDMDSDKKVSMEEYLIGMGQIPKLNHLESEIRTRFQAADKNSDGVLDLDEMKAVLREINSDLSNKQLFDLMHKADKDGSGTIEYDEFLLMFLREQGYVE